MSIFNRDKKPVELPKPALPPGHQATVEIVAHHNASTEVKKEAKEANKTINELLERNHFVVNIVVEAVGTPKKQGSR